jgi:tartrate dehydrogenase/decarboxylase/D-malate dehydrogenase
MMLDHLGENAAARAVMTAIEQATAKGIGTRPGRHSTDQITAAILAALEAAS